jgi:prevent-host-death family protein
MVHPSRVIDEATVGSVEAVNIAEAKARLPELVQRAAAGEEIIIARNGEPQARLVPLSEARSRMPGMGAGAWELGADFNDPLPAELQSVFEGKTSS